MLIRENYIEVMVTLLIDNLYFEFLIKLELFLDT